MIKKLACVSVIVWLKVWVNPVHKQLWWLPLSSILILQCTLFGISLTPDSLNTYHSIFSLKFMALCPRLIRIGRLNMIHCGNSFKIRLKVKFWYIKTAFYVNRKKLLKIRWLYCYFFTTFNSRTGKIELLAIPAEDEIKTVSLSSFKRSGVNQKRC